MLVQPTAEKEWEAKPPILFLYELMERQASPFDHCRAERSPYLVGLELSIDLGFVTHDHDGHSVSV